MSSGTDIFYVTRWNLHNISRVIQSKASGDWSGVCECAAASQTVDHTLFNCSLIESLGTPHLMWLSSKILFGRETSLRTFRDCSISSCSPEIFWMRLFENWGDDFRDVKWLHTEYVEIVFQFILKINQFVKKIYHLRFVPPQIQSYPN